MRSKLFSGIFGHFFIRTSIIQAISGILLLIVVIPFFNRFSDEMAAEQGRTFANSTLAATYDALYKKDYSQIVDYCINVMRDTPNILMIVYSNRNGEELIMTPNNWQLGQKSLPYYKMQFPGSKELLVEDRPYKINNENNPFSKKNDFEFSTPVAISGEEWGVLTISFSKNAYFSIIKSFYWAVIIFSIVSCALSLFLFFASSSRIREQLSHFTQIAKKLAQGKLSTRASETAVGEIAELGKAINEMSKTLEEKSSRVLQLAQIVEQTNDAFILFDAKYKIIFVNDAITHISGFPTDFFQGKDIVDFSDALNIDLSELLRELEWMVKNRKNMPSRDIAITRKDKSSCPVEVRLEYIEDVSTKTRSFLMVLSSITERKKLENELHQLAFYDKLTGLPNRRMFLDHLGQLIRLSIHNNKTFALFFMDLDNFKYVNDSLGHEAGDQLLIQTAGRLKEIFRSSDMVTRLGGDEFTVLIENTKSEDTTDITLLAEKILARLAKSPVAINGRSFSVNTSIGIARFPEDGQDSDTLLRNADTAMYAAKRSGKNRYAFFSEEMNSDLQQHIEMEIALKEATFSKDQIVLHYQPIVDLSTRKIVGAEALARWHHPEKGLIPPSEFIKIAEKSDLISTLSNNLLHSAFKQAKKWQASPNSPYLSVNISVKQFTKDGFIGHLEGLIESFGVDPSKILLEFTENVMLDSSNETFEKFEKLKNLGFKIGIDDFGTGYSSMGYIHKLPIDVLKIDRTFVEDVIHNQKTRAIVTAITKLSSSLGITTIAEGIEREEDAAFLKELHCDFGQGYLFDEALEIAAFEKKYLY